MKTPSEPCVAIIVTNYNGATTFYRSKPIIWHVLNSIKKTSYPNYKIVFADDSSTDDSVAYVKSHFDKIHIAVNKPNGGYTRNANNGIKYALKKLNPDYILNLNNDVIIKDKKWLKKLVSAAESDPRCGIAGPKLLYPDGKLQQAGITEIGPIIRNRGWNTGDAKKYSGTEEVSAVGGVAQLIKKSVLKKIGLMDENFFMGSDDVEYCVRASKSGFRILYVGSAEVIHLEGFTSRKVSTTRGKDYWFPIFQINNMYFAFKHLSRIQILEAAGLALLSSIIGVGNRKMSISSIRFKNRIPWRIFVSVRAIFTGYNLYRGKITREKAYGL